MSSSLPAIRPPPTNRPPIACHHAQSTLTTAIVVPRLPAITPRHHCRRSRHHHHVEHATVGRSLPPSRLLVSCRSITSNMLPPTVIGSPENSDEYRCHSPEVLRRRCAPAPQRGINASLPLSRQTHQRHLPLALRRMSLPATIWSLHH